MSEPAVRNWDRLPKWAQYEIVNARKLIVELRKELALARGETESLVIIDPYDDEPGYLPDNVHIHFQLGPEWHEYLSVRMTEAHGDRRLEVRSGTMGIGIRPMASNMAEIKLDEK